MRLLVPSIVTVIAALGSGVRADDQGFVVGAGPVAGGDWTPGGLRLDLSYLLRLDGPGWLDAGLDLTLGGSQPGCGANLLAGYYCDHGLFSGQSLGFHAGARHFFGEHDDTWQPFVRGGIAMAAVRYPDELVVTHTDSKLPGRLTKGLYGVAVSLRLGGGIRVPLSPEVALLGTAELELGGGGFTGTAEAKDQLGLAVTGGVELVPHFTPASQFTPRTGRYLSLAGVAGVYAPFITWEYYAWYHGARHIPLWFDTAWHDETPTLHTYAGGADKAGHMWIHYTLTRGTTEVLVAGGWNKWAASMIAFGVDQLEATFSEMKDGPVWGYEVGDTTANFTGALLGVAMENIPTLDKWFDFRLQYWPSHAYIQLLKAHPFSRGDGLDISQDYTGQSYMLAMHLGAAPYDHESPYLRWAEFTDVVVGFQAEHYEPAEPGVVRYRTVYAGLSVNMQAVLEALLPPSRGRTIGHGIAEVYSLPYTTLRLATDTSSWDPKAPTPAL